MKHLAALVFLFLSAFLTADELSEVQWPPVNGGIPGWTGTFSAGKGGEMVVKKGVVHTGSKYPAGGRRSLNVRFALKGTGAGIGLYYYDRAGRLLGRDPERIPNAEETRFFQAVFRIPDKWEGKEIFSFRIYFSSGSGMTLSQFHADLQTGKGIADVPEKL